MGSVVSESSGRVRVSVEHGAGAAARAASLTPGELRVLARGILDKEPSEIRALMRLEPETVVTWVSQLKTQHLEASETVDVWRDALDHIRLSTLSPLKFAAE